ncbi:MAG TPA: PD-(D/E)XK nuclease family protein [Candidatus Stackebrandtia faecavium]|nr:PD-(D/E)XK nuclease family protein [Candidatus Stackebrandtia faecavium]
MPKVASAPRSLSPSRANDFKNCPLQYRFRVIDKLPEPTTAAMMKGTLVHAVLENLYDFPGLDRTRATAIQMLKPQWLDLCASDPRAKELFTNESPQAESDFLAEAGNLIHAYFELEDPQRLQPAQRESRITAETSGGVPLKGFIDRLDVAPNGDVRVVDYKTGKSPKPAFETQALWQLKFYGLALWRTRGKIPRMLRMLYLKDARILDYSPSEADLVAVEKSIASVWEAIGNAVASGDFQPRRSPLCGWCAFKQYCPEFSGTPPQYPLPIAIPGTQPVPATGQPGQQRRG